MIDRFLKGQRQFTAADVGALYAALVAQLSSLGGSKFAPRTALPSTRKLEPRSVQVTQHFFDAGSGVVERTYSTEFRFDSAAAQTVPGTEISKLTNVCVSGWTLNAVGTFSGTLKVYVNDVEVASHDYVDAAGDLLDQALVVNPVAQVSPGDRIKLTLHVAGYGGGAASLTSPAWVDLWLETLHVE